MFLQSGGIVTECRVRICTQRAFGDETLCWYHVKVEDNLIEPWSKSLRPNYENMR